MNTLSSGDTIYFKTFAPWTLYTMCAVTFFVGLIARPFIPALLIAPVIAAAFGSFWFAATVSDLADEVIDNGDSLLVRRGAVQERVMLTDIVGVSLDYMANPTRLTLKLRRVDRFDGAIVFIPKRRGWSLFSQRQLADELEARINRLKKYAGVQGGVAAGNGGEPSPENDE